MNQPREAKKPTADDQRGIVCPKCGYAHFRVIYTRARWGGRIIRRRECRRCGHRITTYERANPQA